MLVILGAHLMPPASLRGGDIYAIAGASLYI